MARKKTAEQAIHGDLASLREGVTRKFFGLSERVYAHIMASTDALTPCTLCSMDPTTGEHKPGRVKDDAGKCGMCHGTYVVPDTRQRNWAVEQALPLVTQSNKQVDVKVDNKSVLPELEAAIRRLSDKSLQDKLAMLGISEVIDVEREGTGGANSGSDTGRLPSKPVDVAGEVRKDGENG